MALAAPDLGHGVHRKRRVRLSKVLAAGGEIGRSAGVLADAGERLVAAEHGHHVEDRW
jgi:hypothetical protein